MKLILIPMALVGLLILRAPAQVQPQPEGQSTLSVCQLLLEPARFNGKVITVRGQHVGTSEGQWLRGTGCEGLVVTAAHSWPIELALAPAPAAGVPKYPYIHAVDFTFDFSSPARLKKKFQALSQTVPSSCIEVVYTGMFETYLDQWKSKIGADGNTIYLGLGHLNEAPGQLVPKSFDDAVPIPGCRAPANPADQH